MRFYKMGFLTLFFSILTVQCMEEQTNKRKRNEERDHRQVDTKRPRISIESAGQEQDLNLGDFEILPNELIFSIIKLILADNINNWNDICNFDSISLKAALDKMCLISKNFNVCKKEELKNFVKQLKEKRAARLQEIIEEVYEPLSQEMLDKYLMDLLNIDPVTKENMEEATRFIIAGAKINTKNIDGQTALTIAIEQGYTEIVKLLIAKDDEFNISDTNSSAALIRAIEQDHVKTAKLLIKYGANTNTSDRYGCTPLMWAIDRGHMELVRSLIEYGADINTKTEGGWIALMSAAYCGRTEIARLLIEHGADINAKTKRNSTALTLAQDNGHTEIAILLKENGAKDSWRCCIS